MQMIFLVTNLHLSICKLELDLDRYAELFNLQYCVDGDVSLKKAIVCIRSIRNVSIHMYVAFKLQRGGWYGMGIPRTYISSQLHRGKVTGRLML